MRSVKSLYGASVCLIIVAWVKVEEDKEEKHSLMNFRKNQALVLLM